MKKTLGLLTVVGVLVGCGNDTKIWKEEYSQDKVKEEYQYYNHPENNRRIREGWYNSYYPDGEYLEVGTYEDNERVGEWVYFTEDGEETKGIYKDGKKWSGKFWIRVKHGSLRFWEETADDLSEGDRDGDEVFGGRFFYDDGLWNGLGVLYWKNGNKRGEGFYRDGKPEGLYGRYLENGKVLWEANYVDGKREGKRVEYFESGKVRGEANYVDGKREGKRVEYFESGKVSWEANYVDGKREGVVEYFRSGKIRAEGKPTAEGRLWVFFYEKSGKISAKGCYVGDKKEGLWIEYYESSEKMEREGSYVDGRKEGKWIWHAEEGNETVHSCYKMGEPVVCPQGE
jgi:uncharacterized protein